MTGDLLSGDRLRFHQRRGPDVAAHCQQLNVIPGRHLPVQIAVHLERADVSARADRADLVTSGQAAATLLEPGQTALVCAGPGVEEALRDRGVQTVLRQVGRQRQQQRHGSDGWGRVSSSSARLGVDSLQLALGPAGEVYREAGDKAKQQHEQIVAAMKAALTPYATPEGVVMDSSSWKITARNPN